MCNLIKMDLYRLVRSASTYVMIVALICFNLFSTYMIRWELENADRIQLQQTLTQTDSDETSLDLNFGIYVKSQPEWLKGDVDFAELLSTHLNGTLLLFVAIFTTLFVIAEYKCGFLKNIAGQYPNRAVLVLGRMIAVAVQIALIMGIFTFATLISGLVIFPGQLTLYSGAALFKLLGLQYLLHLAFGCLILFFCLCSRSSAFSMSVSILLSMNFASLLYSLIDQIVSALASNVNFHIGQYAIESLVSFVNIQNMNQYIRQVVLTGLIYGVGCITLSCLIMQKRDVK